jgi:hypothetical protein
MTQDIGTAIQRVKIIQMWGGMVYTVVINELSFQSVIFNSEKIGL